MQNWILLLVADAADLTEVDHLPKKYLAETSIGRM